jgi:2-iminobutanoate/2-iminopropanoate deaminase
MKLASLLVILCPTLGGCASASHGAAAGARFINPPGLVRPTGYTHVVVGPDERTVYIAGQVAFDSTGKLVGAGDFRAQAEQVYANLGRALASVGGNYSHLVKTTTFIVDVRTNGAALREVRTRYLDAVHPPANTLAPVPELARPDLLIEIEAVAVVPHGRATPR